MGQQLSMPIVYGLALVGFPVKPKRKESCKELLALGLAGAGKRTILRKVRALRLEVAAPVPGASCSLSPQLLSRPRRGG